jgi:hypothetical protein
MRNAAIGAFLNAIPEYVFESGLLSDELTDASIGASAGQQIADNGRVHDPLDERILPASTIGGVASYGSLQGVRSYTNQAIGALATYDSVNSSAVKTMRAELYALQGYADIMLADLFCSGIPLSTLDFEQDFTYAPGLTTTEVYSHALAKFDTALALVPSDSTQIVYLAQVGRGRAFLDLNQLDSAAASVSSVPNDFHYTVFPWWGSYSFSSVEATVSDREGRNGLPYRSSGDPRTAVVQHGTNTNTDSVSYFPKKYATALTGAGYTTFIVADGVEARLIQAEAALAHQDIPTWLSILNGLRATAPIPGTTQPQPDRLPPLTDPGTSAARLDTLFTERAAWLFQTGHRQGDLRRMLRQYSAVFGGQADVYPDGLYPSLGAGVYGTDVNVPVPMAETANPYFHGCLNRDP